MFKYYPPYPRQRRYGIYEDVTPSLYLLFIFLPKYIALLFVGPNPIYQFLFLITYSNPMFFGDLTILYLFFISNALLLMFYRNPGNFYHVCLAFLPLYLSLLVGLGLHSIIFFMITVYYLIIRKNASNQRSYDWHSMSMLGFMMYSALYMTLFAVTTPFCMFLVIEIMFVFSLMLLLGNKGFDFAIDLYAIPNILVSIGIAMDILCLMLASRRHGLGSDSLLSELVVSSLEGSLFMHFAIIVLVFFIGFKLYVMPGCFYVPMIYQNMTTAQIALFSTIFTLPYMYLAVYFFSSLPKPYQLLLFYLIVFTIIWCCLQLIVESRLKAIIGIMTIFTQNVLLLILVCGPSFISSHYVYVTLVFLMFYLMSIMPFLYLLSRTDCNGMLDLRLDLFLMNTFRSYVFYLSWLALSGLPLTFLYVTKLITLTQLMGLITSGFLFWVYLIFSFYLYLVFFFFLFYQKKSTYYIGKI